MSVFKCKLCGSAFEINNDESVGVCEYCGMKQTLPKLDNEKRAILYDRANHFRMNNEFDNAKEIYEQILSEDSTDAEAYWSLVLCRYGIEYVEDPRTHKSVPTVNRAQFMPIFEDENYKSALQHADIFQRAVYEEEARAINEIQSGILAISQKEEPFDVFICYKAISENGMRTHDSVLANDLYYLLTQEGFKVFFSRITLEDKLGSAYEPYIFAALNSAKVMVVLGTKPEYFRSVWVRNEWSRYLSLIKQGHNKMLIPAYKDMDPYDLPEEFSHLQAQDMSRLGFMQDLIRGIKKIVQTEEYTDNAIANSNKIDVLLKRTFLFLEDGDWNSANEYCEMVLNIDPENAFAYLCKLMVDLRVNKQEDLMDLEESFADNNNYKKAIRYADEKLKTKLLGYVKHINARNETAHSNDIYTSAKRIMESAQTETSYEKAALLFESIGGYLDSGELARLCYENAEIKRKDAILAQGKAEMMGDTVGDAIFMYDAAIRIFETIPGWRDADECAEICKQKIAGINRKRKKVIVWSLVICAGIALFLVLKTLVVPAVKYGNAKDMMDQGKYAEAIIAFEALDGYNDSRSMIAECKKGLQYNEAIELIENGNVVKGYEALIALAGYADSSDKAKGIYNVYVDEILKTIKSGDRLFFGEYEQNNNHSSSEILEWLVLDVSDGKALLICRNAIDCKKYNNENADVTWETCTLRKWLNDEFINMAFSDSEKDMIQLATVSADKNPQYNTDSGEATQDKVFLLSIAEVNKYFSSDSTRRCMPTDYTVANKAWKSSSGNCWWWLRTSGCYQDNATSVSIDGDVHMRGYRVDREDIAIRPAMWIDLNF